MKNKKCALKALRNCDGLGIRKMYDKKNNPYCAIGVITSACGYKPGRLFRPDRLYEWWPNFFLG